MLLFFTFAIVSIKNPKLDFQLITYTKPSRFKIVIAWAASQNIGKSRVLDDMIKFFIDKKFTPLQQKNLMDLFDKMTPEQKKNPSKYWDMKND